MKRGLLILAAVVVVVGSGFAVVRHQQPGWWVRLWYPLSYQQDVVGYAHQYHLSPTLVAAVIYKESHFNANARSDAGAVGLMQLLPSTATGDRAPHRRRPSSTRTPTCSTPTSTFATAAGICGT